MHIPFPVFFALGGIAAAVLTIALALSSEVYLTRPGRAVAGALAFVPMSIFLVSLVGHAINLFALPGIGPV